MYGVVITFWSRESFSANFPQFSRFILVFSRYFSYLFHRNKRLIDDLQFTMFGPKNIRQHHQPEAAVSLVCIEFDVKVSKIKIVKNKPKYNQYVKVLPNHTLHKTLQLFQYHKI